jgi:hypothetical protein
MTGTTILWIVIISAMFAFAVYYMYYVWFTKAPYESNPLDVNKDGKVDMQDAKAVVDINKDGAVNMKDLEAAVDKAVEEIKSLAPSAKKKAPAKKAPAKKAPAKKAPKKKV